MNKTSTGIGMAILKKDALALYPLLLLTMLLQMLDVLVSRFDAWSALSFFLPTMIGLANGIVTLAVIQADSPVSLTDDWLCRPVPRRALIPAKLGLLALVIYVPRVLTVLAVDLLQGRSLVESAWEAVLFHDSVELLYLPIVLMVAVCTASVIQGVGVMIGLFILVFVIPTPFISPPGPENLSVGEALQVNGAFWMAMIPGKTIFIVAAVLCLWCAYARRNQRAARAVLAGGVSLGVLAIVAPIVLLPWQSTFALQKTSQGRQPAPVSPSLHQVSACFPATRVPDAANDRQFDSVGERFGLRLWGDERLKSAGKDAIAFVTQTSVRGLPEDWRVQIAYVQANYYGSGAAPLVQLRPARFTTPGAAGLAGGAPGSEIITRAWLLPETALHRLAQADAPRLELEYSAAMLEPVSLQLPADGKRRHLPGIGYCSAKRNALDDRIAVDCLSVGHLPALISAELAGIPASRVDAGPVDFAPRLLRALQVQQTTVEVQSPDLIESDVVTLRAYFPKGFATLRAASNGLLGDSLTACPAPSAASQLGPQMSTWNDRSPHEVKSVAVEENVQIEVLDWGGSGPAMVLLHGLGATAHSFDDLAPLLSKHYRVIGMTRRGIGRSSHPDHGYGQARLAQDILRVLDAFGIDKAVFVGHSIAGDELSTLGAHHSQRVTALIYLDAAYDRTLPVSSRYRELNASLPDRPQPRPEELLSYTALRGYFDRVGSAPLPEGEAIAMWNVNDRHLAGQRTIDLRLLQAIEAGIPRPDYARVHAPALAIYATSAGPDALLQPWHDRTDTDLRNTLRELQSMKDAMQRREIEKFRTGVQGARVLEIPGASHWILLSHRDAVLQAIDEFTATLPAAPSIRRDEGG
ncbi:MAG TPA: alpha/beta hydrolase [Povalibacter sp.]|uniref:alpha/beta hydrolase n=1 Tax=Povalibacter sp. TaxID=1962978 RepID=UPI002B95B72A|nr:alpha/beta hydrolase [Povalibacter sp.]HMN43976.1 alpha/beta hydrolase [Povalibacter sp.]